MSIAQGPRGERHAELGFDCGEAIDDGRRCPVLARQEWGQEVPRDDSDAYEPVLGVSSVRVP